MLILKNNLIASLSIITNFLKTKIESHSDEATYFYNKKIAKAGFNYTSLAVISLDSAVKKDENYYPQVFKIPNVLKKSS